MTVMVMDGKRRMTLHLLDVYDNLRRAHFAKPIDREHAQLTTDSLQESDEMRWFRESFDGPDTDLMMVPLVERCECGNEMRVGDYVCIGSCYACGTDGLDLS